MRDDGRHSVSVAGMAVRLPGASSLEGLWEMLQSADSEGLSTLPLPAPAPASPAAAARRHGGKAAEGAGGAAYVRRKGVVADEGLELVRGGGH